ncbi:MAG: cyclic nucleotide-binding domain-containing protein [Chloroflexi bacterium]|nr:cyclic nucleotide-binding domain-containing protein [Chloroflexota bacterium]
MNVSLGVVCCQALGALLPLAAEGSVADAAGPSLGRAALASLLATIATLSLLVGAALGLYARPGQRVIAAVMAFGSGALIQALVVELAFEGAERLVREHHLPPIASWLWVAGGFVVGGFVYFLANRLIEGWGGALRKPATAKEYFLEKKREESAALLTRLSKVDLLRSLPPQEMQEVLPFVHAVRVPAGTAVFERGEQGNALYLIDEGHVEIVVRPVPAGPSSEPAAGTASGVVPVAATTVAAPPEAPAVLARLGPGQSFGEMALLSGEPRSASAVAVEDATLLRIAKDDFDHLISGSPALRHAVAELSHHRVLQNIRQAPQTDPEQWQRIAVQSIQRLNRHEQEALMKAHGGSSGAPIGIFLGALLDGIPESIVIGAGFTTLASFNPTFLVAVFMSNLPEAMSSAAGMRHGGFSARRIFSLWGGLVVGSAIAAALGNVFLASAAPTAITFVEALAGGGILAMLAATMMPEAFEHGGPSVGLSTIAGFLSAFLFTALGMH